MHDKDVRESLWRLLKNAHENDSDTLMLNELGILNGTTRIDIAVINGEMEGYELKSERDTLERLPTQRDLYNKVLDRISLVVAENHRAAALAIIPKWWGLSIAVNCKFGVEIRQERLPKFNPTIDASSLASLLWRDEALDLLKRFDADKGVRSKPREVIYERIAEALDINLIRYEVRSTLKAREGWRTDRRFPRYDG